MHMVDNLKIHLKSLRYAIWRLTKAWTPISYDSSVDIRDGYKPLPTSMIKRFLFLVGSYFKRAYSAKPSDDWFWNVKMIFLTIIM